MNKCLTQALVFLRPLRVPRRRQISGRRPSASVQRYKTARQRFPARPASEQFSCISAQTHERPTVYRVGSTEQKIPVLVPVSGAQSKSPRNSASLDNRIPLNPQACGNSHKTRGSPIETCKTDSSRLSGSSEAPLSSCANPGRHCDIRLFAR